MRSTRLMAAAITAALATGSLALASPASADPTPAGTFRKLVGVGSDTTQDVLNALANGTSSASAVKATNGDGIASYDAVEPGTGSTTSTITTRSGGTAFLRPNGSGAGRTALSSSLTNGLYPLAGGVNVNGQIDFARSSGGPSVVGTSLTYVPMARDAVGVAVLGSKLQNLTIAQLHDIYAGTLTTVNGQTVHPHIPQSGSGTRKFFLSAIGLSDSDIKSDVVTTVQENQADDALKTDGDLVPFSAASWIAQLNHVSPDHSSTAVTAGAYMAGIELDPGAVGTFTSPVATVAGKVTPVDSYYSNATFGRDVYNVVPSRAIDPTSAFYDDSLYDIFVTVGTHKAELASDTSKTVIADYGFLNESYDGSIDPTKHAKFGGLENGAATTLPSKPTLTATPGAGSLALSWTVATSNGLPVTDYRAVVTAPDGSVVANKDVKADTLSTTFTGLAAGSYTVSLTANNLVGAGDAATWTGAVSAVQSASTTKASAPKTAYGKTPKVAVTVTSAGSAVPTGKVTVKEGTKTLGSATLNSSGKASVSLSKTLKVATHTLTVSYAGDANTKSSKATAKLTIVKATASVSSSAPKTISHTKRAKVTVKVTATGTTPTGKVRIYEGTKVIATGTLSHGKVTITLPTLKKGTHKLHARYLGSTTVNAKSGATFSIKST
ncbi:Ig-like domain repeat protein [Actinacidiphila soli]|uniref:Ig-like domain repeat protein n=1 Tax=Actinacidiphila soli TaxID=2487275 RepID=UPI000FCCDB98|nr:Ig-like domain repeat protein [Actinacidiphila soli]